MSTRVRAVQALRLNYTWRGVVVWLRGYRYQGRPGWVWVLRDPEHVIRSQVALAEGVFS